ncbi:L-2-amino-thiazoline-4-carboxylic acid hydrolase [Caproicibacter fermentans]|uniref:L-2-amino-thiazoline-4-carboxylic acid hydrolase n=2 Tax=Caproicibacter fermentans TaxID=2576756 RepID=A0A7G8TAL0_9FIRM|nr:L-2-amino-thiazoline-4-carboxylic acid hydrolase [Caproicibacter fermentans]
MIAESPRGIHRARKDVRIERNGVEAFIPISFSPGDAMQILGISEITPVMCSYDYDMAGLGGSVFNRRHTLARGGLCRDCHYQKKKGFARR